MFTVMEEEDKEEEDRLASEDDIEEEDDQSPRARLLRGLGISLAEGQMQDDQPPEDDPEEPVETAADQEATPEDVVKLEPEKEKKTPSSAEQDHLEYCSMEAIAERWKSKPRGSIAASADPEANEDRSTEPPASAQETKTKTKKHPTLLLAEQLRIEGEVAVVQYDTGATTSLVSSSFLSKLSLFSQPEKVCVSISSGIDGEPVEATRSHELYIRYPRGSAHAARFLEVENIRRLPRPPQEDVLDVIFPHPEREDWAADWGLTGGEVDILLGADMIHLFP